MDANLIGLALIAVGLTFGVLVWRGLSRAADVDDDEAEGL